MLILATDLELYPQWAVEELTGISPIIVDRLPTREGGVFNPGDGCLATQLSDAACYNDICLPLSVEIESGRRWLLVIFDVSACPVVGYYKIGGVCGELFLSASAFTGPGCGWI